MSYNGIGLQTPRGSGTSGYVQKNLSGPNKEGLRRKREREAHEEHIREVLTKQKQIRKGAGTEIVAHDRKRLIEVKCMELRDKLEDEDVPDEIVERKVAELRAKLTGEVAEADKKSDSRKSLYEKEKQLELTVDKKDDGKDVRSEKSTKKCPGKSSQKTDSETPSKLATLRENGTDVQETEINSFSDSPAPYDYVPRYANR